jgi:MFS family permease
LVVTAGYMLSCLGDRLALVALTLRVEETTGSGPAVSGLFLAGLLPIVLLGPVAGLFVDRFETTRLIRLTVLVQAVASATLAVTTSLPLTYVLVAVLGVGEAITLPSMLALLPVIVGENRATASYATMEVSSRLAFIAGPALGGLLAAAIGTRGALFLNAASFAVFAAATLLLRVRRPPAAQVREVAFLRGLAGGVAAVSREPVLRVALVTITASVVFGTVVNAVSVFFVKDTLGAGDATYGALTAVWAVGMLTGSGLVGPRLGDSRQASVLAVSGLLLGGALVGAALAPGVAVAFVAFLAAGVANGLAALALRALVRIRTPDELRGRAFGTTSSVVNGASVLGTLAGGLLLAPLGPTGCLIFGGVGAAVASLLALPLLASTPRVALRR